MQNVKHSYKDAQLKQEGVVQLGLHVLKLKMRVHVLSMQMVPNVFGWIHIVVIGIVLRDLSNIQLILNVIHF